MTTRSIYATVGDATNLIIILSSLVFCGCVVRYMHDDTSHLFDDEWKREGFCIKNENVAYWSSHDVCLYVDTAFAILFAVIYLAMRHSKDLKGPNTFLKSNVIGMLAHGMGHGILGMALRQGDLNEEKASNLGYIMLREQSFTQTMLYQIPGFVFWNGLLKAAMPDFENSVVAELAALAQIFGLLIPLHFGFTYVQTILMLLFALNQLVQKEKGFEYATYPAVVGFPVIVVGWMESTQCSNFVKDRLYGHVVYDASIPILVLLWYGLCYIHASSATKEKTA